MPTAKPLTSTEDIKLLQQYQRLKAKLSRLDQEMKPRIKATIDTRGEGTFTIGGKTVELSRTQRQSVSWQAFIRSMVDEASIDEHKHIFTETYDIDRCKVVN